tara:strand:- start:180 stop:503 length:324 start_codon:yes stop_codon:yes gene_type:complete
MKNESIFTKFIVRKAIVASAITFLMANQTQKLASLLVDTIIEPLFSIDLDKDGNPDLKQLEKFVIEIIGIKFPLGKLITQIIKYIVFLIFIYYILNFFINNTHLVEI